MSSGTYQVQGTNVTITNGTSGKAETDSFCVSGNTLSLYQVTANGATASMTLVK
jgi:hypothetical protein